MPEANAIGWIDGGHGVITPPPFGKGLTRLAIGHYGFTLAQVI
jgi:hypothetical protein